MRLVSAADAAGVVQSGQSVYLHCAAATPSVLLQALVDRAQELRDVSVVHLHTEGPGPHLAPEMAGHFRHRALFIGPNARAAVNEGRADYVPVFLSDVPRLFESGALPLDVVFVNATPPDAHGFCSLGTSVEAMHAAIRAAKTVVVQLNRSMPRTLGDSFIHVDDIDLGVEVDVPPYAHASPIIGDVEERIGAHVAALVPDRATLQLGIGAIPAATAMALMDKHDLGIHTEMFTDAVVDLVEAGVVTGAAKERNRGKIVTSFLMGSPRLYAFVHDNPMVEMRPVDFTNDTHVIRSFSRMVSINSAIEVDLTGQVVADSIGHTMYSGVGGQMDFIRGAGLATEGRSVIALPVDRGRRDSLPDRRCPARGRRRRHDPGPRPHGRHRVGRRRAVRQEPARAGQGADRASPTRTSGPTSIGKRAAATWSRRCRSGRTARGVATNGAGWRAQWAACSLWTLEGIRHEDHRPARPVARCDAHRRGRGAPHRALRPADRPQGLAGGRMTRGDPHPGDGGGGACFDRGRRRDRRSVGHRHPVLVDAAGSRHRRRQLDDALPDLSQPAVHRAVARQPRRPVGRLRGGLDIPIAGWVMTRPERNAS